MMLESAVLIVVCILLSALFSGVETGSYTVNRIRLRHRERERQRSAVSLSRLLRHPYIFIYTVLIGNNIVNFLISKEVTDLYLDAGLQAGNLVLGFIPWNAEVAATLTLMFPLFLLGELGPKNWFRKKADTVMYRLAWLLRIMVFVFLPVTWPLKQLFHFLTHGTDSASLRDLHRLSPDALREYFTVGEKEGVISSHQNRMLENVTAMHRMPVRALMTPFKQVPCLPDHASVADFKQLVAARGTPYAILMHKHAVVGLVSMFSVVSRKLGDGQPLKPYAEEVLKLQENRNLKSAFFRLRRNPRHSALVVDALNHPIGFIRLEDVARFIAQS